MTARTPITPYVTNRAGTSDTPLDLSTMAPVACDVANGNVVANDGRTVLDIHNTNSGSTAHPVTFVLSGGGDGQTITPKSVSIPATKTYRLGPWPVGQYGGALKFNGSHVELTVVATSLASN